MNNPGKTGNTPFRAKCSDTMRTCPHRVNVQIFELWTGSELRRIVMDNSKCKNESIRCSVSQCKHNMVTEDYCSLDSISVGTHEDDPEVPECTDCNSFCKRTGC